MSGRVSNGKDARKFRTVIMCLRCYKRSGGESQGSRHHFKTMHRIKCWGEKKK